MKCILLGAFLATVLPLAAMAGFDEGKTAYDAGDYATAAKEWQPLAEQGDIAARAQMARLYIQGRGVHRDEVLAAKLARETAEKGDPYGQNVLGTMYHSGEGPLKKDFGEAAIWYRKAADQGLAMAQTNLGRLHWDGEGVNQSKDEARYWYQKAADQDNAEGQFLLGYSYVNKGIRDFVTGAYWYRKAVRHGHAIAQLYLAEIYNFSVTETRLQTAYDNEESDHLGDWQSIANATPRDLVIAYVLYTLAERGGEVGSYGQLATLTGQLSQEQKAEADAILATWKPGQELPLTSKTGAAPRVVDAPPTGKPR